MKLRIGFSIAVLLVSVPGFATVTAKSLKGKRTSDVQKVSGVQKAESGTSEVKSSVGTPVMNAVKGARIRPMLGYNFFDPKALNNRLGEMAQANGVNTTYKIGGGPSFGLNVDYPVIQNFYVGARIDYFRAASNKVSVGTGQSGFNHQTALSGLPLMAMASYQLPVAERVTVGATAAAGIPLFYRVSMETANSNMQGVPNGVATFSDNPLTGLLAVHGDYSFTDRIGMRLEGGYRLLTSENMTLDEAYGDMKAGTLLKDKNNAPVKVDASSFHAAASLVVTL